MNERLPKTTWKPGVSSATPPPPEVARTAADPAEKVWAVVLAGGAGTRLQQFIRHITGSERPKQFCRIVGTRSMLRHTWDRTRQIVPPHRIVTVLTAGQERYLSAEETLGGVPGSVLVQPANRETAPGLLLPLLWITERDPSATVVVFPADHFIWEEASFLSHVRAAVLAAQRFRDRLVVLSVEADAPEPSYGWIAPGLPCEAGEGVELYHVREFWEKPDRATAARLFGSGCLWNTFVLVGHLTAFVRAARNTVPDLLESLTVAAAFLGTRYEAEILGATYQKLRATDFSRALLAGRPEALLTLPVRGVYWSDWGNPDRILQTLRRFDRRPRWLPAYARTTLAPGIEAL
jgi:mannose-1-phosphate guanylyltransferase